MQLRPYSFHLSPNSFLSTLFSSTINVCSSIDVGDQISQSNKTVDKVSILYILN